MNPTDTNDGVLTHDDMEELVQSSFATVLGLQFSPGLPEGAEDGFESEVVINGTTYDLVLNQFPSDGWKCDVWLDDESVDLWFDPSSQDLETVLLNLSDALHIINTPYNLSLEEARFAVGQAYGEHEYEVVEDPDCEYSFKITVNMAEPLSFTFRRHENGNWVVRMAEGWGSGKLHKASPRQLLTSFRTSWEAEYEKAADEAR